MEKVVMSFTDLPPLHHLLQVNFTPTKYLVWKTQFDPILNCFNLHSLVKDDKSEKIVQNPKFLTWWRKDQLLRSWLLSSLTEEVSQHTIELNLSVDIWETL